MNFRRFCAAGAALLASALWLTASTGLSQTTHGRYLAGHTTRADGETRDLGPESSSRTLSLTVWLRSAMDDAAADRMVAELYDTNSPNFHHWMTQAQADAALAPTAAQLATVRQYLAERHLRVTGGDPSGYYLKAEGTVRDVQNAFRVQIHRFSRNGSSYHANTGDPWVEDPAASLIVAIDGLAEHRMHPHNVRPVDPDTGEAFPAVPLSAGPEGVFFAAQCFRPPETHTFETNGGLPSATYSGNRYGADITNTALGTLPPCGYQPSELQSAYGLTAMYAAGFDGTGQTVVIVDAIGSPTIAADAEIFSQVYGLPDLTASNFNIYFPGGPPPAPDSGWATETSLDVEWSHSVAPQANIALVIAPTSSDPDLQAGVLFAIEHHLGNSISNSYGEAEADVPPAMLSTWYHLARMGAARGMSVNFASGDGGDSNPSGFTPGLVLPGVSVPASVPWATAVGGTSVFLDQNDHVSLQTGWGTNLTRIVDRASLGSPPIVPPLELGFQFGSGGGSSGVFAKPGFQGSLPGTQRLVPDIAFTADPYTGVEVICDSGSCSSQPPGTPLVGVIGGTSLATPMFSALWAVANQGRGGEHRLGQAARLVYGLPAGAITDVNVTGGSHNVHGRIKTSSGTTSVSADDLAQPLDSTKHYVSAFYNGTSTRWYVITFGTDSSLTTAKGWDDVTGLGTPNGLNFIEAVHAAAHDE